MAEGETNAAQGYAEKWAEKMIEAYKIASTNSQQSSAKGKQYYDRKNRGVTLQPGDRVLVRNVAERGGPCKLKPYWEKTIYIVREQLGDNPVYKVSPETGSRPIRTLQRNLLLQVNDLPVERAPEDTSARSQKRIKRSTQSLSRDEQAQYLETIESDDEEGGSQYWLRMPRGTQGDEIAMLYQRVIGETQEGPEQVETHLAEAAPVEATSENESEPCGEEPQCNDEQDLPQVNGPDSEVQEAQSDTQPTLRRSSRDRRPGQMLTYSSLGQPTYQPRFIVGAICAQPTVYTQQYPQVLLLPLSLNTHIPIYLSASHLSYHMFMNT